MTKNKRSIGIIGSSNSLWLCHEIYDIDISTIGSKNSSKTLFQLKTSIPFVLLSSHWQSTPLYLRDSRSGQIPFAKKRYNLRLHGSMTTHFSSSTPKKRSGDEE